MDQTGDGSLILLLLAIIVAFYSVQILLRIHRHCSGGDEANGKDTMHYQGDKSGDKEHEKDTSSEVVRSSNVHSDNATFQMIKRDKESVHHRMNDTSIPHSKMQSQTEFPTEEEAIKTDVRDSLKWRCVCEQGFLPPGMLQSFSGMESMVRTSTGKCYHKNN
jgi:hypothetical protein